MGVAERSVTDGLGLRMELLIANTEGVLLIVHHAPPPSVDRRVHHDLLGFAYHRSDDDAIDDTVLRLAAAVGGSISAEHGVAKRDLLPLSRSATDIAVMRDSKGHATPIGSSSAASQAHSARWLNTRRRVG